MVQWKMVSWKMCLVLSPNGLFSTTSMIMGGRVKNQSAYKGVITCLVGGFNPFEKY